MSSSNYKEKEHSFRQIEKDIKAGKIPRLVLLCGKEEYLIRFYTKKLPELFTEESARVMDLIVLEEENATLQNIIENVETFSLMSERKVVVLPEFLPAKGKMTKYFTEKDLQELLKYFEDMPEDCLLLITASEGDEKVKNTKFRTAVEKYGSVYDFQTLNNKDLSNFVEKRIRTAGKTCRPSLISNIIFESGYGHKGIDYCLDDLDNDLKKIIAHSGDSAEIVLEDVTKTLSSNPETDVFRLIDVIRQNRKDEAFVLLHNLLNDGTAVFSLIANIIKQLEVTLSVREMMDIGCTQAMMEKEIGAHRYTIQKAMQVVRGYSSEHLRNILKAAYQVDEYIKTGLMEGRLALEYFIAIL